MKEAKFIREFSKEKSQIERDELAKDIRARRKNYFEEQKNRADKTKSIQETEGDIQIEMEALSELKDQIKEISGSLPRRILEYFKMRKLLADAKIGEKNLEELKEELETKKEDFPILEVKTVEEEWGDIGNIIEDFYKEQKEKWERSEFTLEDIEKYFTEEHLSSLSIEDYKLLMKRFPSEMVTHVTRQGIRDHAGMMYHTAGEGLYSDGFKKIVADGRLRSPLGVYLAEHKKEQGIFDYLEKYFPPECFENKLDFLEAVKKQFDPDFQSDTPGSYSDRMAIHFAAEEVADKFYGSEKGNEIFFAFPANFIASQYYFAGALNNKDGGYWNDQWIWANEEKGIDIDAGVVFIPKDVQVDSKTGSRYELDENLNPKLNTKYIEIIKGFTKNPNFKDFCKKALEILGRSSEATPERMKLLQDELKKDFGILQKDIQDMLLNYHILGSLDTYSYDQWRLEEEIKSGLGDAGIYFEKAKKTVSAAEYWEKYFGKNPTSRPSKIVYYSDNDPTKAFNQWKTENNLMKKSETQDMGFSERNVERDSVEATSGMGRFSSIILKIAEEIPEEKFGKK